MRRDNNRENELSIFYIVASVVLWIITLAWMYLIFFLSSETGEDSSARSMGFLEYVNSIFGETGLTEVMIRKGTHILEYSVLSLLSFLAIRFTNLISPMNSYDQSPTKMIKSDNELYIILSLWFSVLFAILDEYHQLFVTGRTGSIVDVCIDLIGIVVMLLIVRVVFAIYLIRLRRSEIRYD